VDERDLVHTGDGRRISYEAAGKAALVRAGPAVVTTRGCVFGGKGGLWSMKDGKMSRPGDAAKKS